MTVHVVPLVSSIRTSCCAAVLFPELGWPQMMMTGIASCKKHFAQRCFFMSNQVRPVNCEALRNAFQARGSLFAKSKT